MKVARETYIEVVHSLVMAILERELNISQVAMLVHHIAQPEATETRIDITGEIRAALDDWSQEAKGRIIGIEVVHVRFPCHNAHGNPEGDGNCEEGFHVLQMTRVIGQTSFDPETVTSRHKFEDVVVRLSTAHHPAGPEALKLAGHGRGARGGTLAAAFQRMFGEQAKEDIDRKVENFRKELDDLFPSVNPQPRKEEGHESS